MVVWFEETCCITIWWVLECMQMMWYIGFCWERSRNILHMLLFGPVLLRIACVGKTFSTFQFPSSSANFNSMEQRRQLRKTQNPFKFKAFLAASTIKQQWTHLNLIYLQLTCLETDTFLLPTFFPTCQVRVVRFYVSCLLLRCSSSSSSSSCSLPPRPNCDDVSSVFLAGPQPRS